MACPPKSLLPVGLIWCQVPPSPLPLAPLLSTRSRPGTHYVVYTALKLVAIPFFQPPALRLQVCSIKPGDAEECVLCFGLPRASGPSGCLCERTLGVNTTFPVARALLSCCWLWITLMTAIRGFCLLIYSEPLRFCWTIWALYCLCDWHCQFGRFFFFLSKFGVM